MKANSVSFPNQSGTYKKFRSNSAPGIAAWKASYDKPVKVPKVKRTAQDIQNELISAGDDAIAYAFDGGDPIDQLYPWMYKNGYHMNDIDRAYKKVHGKAFYPHLADIWDGAQADALADAKSGHHEESTQFYRVCADGTVKPSQNPWKPK